MLSSPSLKSSSLRASDFGVDWFARALAFAVAYYLAAQLGLLIPSVWMVSLFWPPVGISVGLLLRFGIHHWPGVLLGAFATNSSVGPMPALGFAVGTTAACVLMARLLRRHRLNPAFESVRDLAVLFAVAAVGGAVSAVCGACWSAAMGVLPWPQVGHAMAVWWLGDAGGVVLGAPVVLAWSYPQMVRLRRKGQLRGWLVSFGLLVAVCVALFGGVLPSGQWSTSASFLPLLFIAWAATTYRAWTASAQVVTLGAFVIWANYRLQGPCLYVDPTIRLYAAWAYLITAGVVALGLSGLLAERDAVERKLKTGEETYRALVHDNPALICRFTTEGILLFANETFRRAFSLPAIGDTSRLTRTDLRKPKCADYNFFLIAGVAEDHAVLTLLRDIKQPDRPALFECKVVTGDGEVRWFRWTARAVDMASSVVTEYHAVGLDVTEQKSNEAKRKAIEAQAVQTQQYEAIGVLAGGIAHEFNNILTSIVGNTDLALMLLPNENTVRPMLTDVMTGAQRAAELTKQLSIFAGRTNTHSGPVNLSELVRSSEGFIGVVVPRRCPLKYELAVEGAIAVADEAKVRQLLMTLVTNAAEAMADLETRGEIVLRTSVFSLGSDSAARNWVNGDALTAGEYVQLEVADTGCGMTSGTLTRIFEPFFTTKFPGRGLGMAAVLGIVQDHRGAIQVQSQKGKGTTVRVLFPAMASVAVDHPTPTPLPRSGRRNVRLSEVIMMTRRTVP